MKNSNSLVWGGDQLNNVTFWANGLFSRATGLFQYPL
jgi:hypothetical protein